MNETTESGTDTQTILYGGLLIYGISSLTSMALMNLGFGVLLLAILWTIFRGGAIPAVALPNVFTIRQKLRNTITQPRPFFLLSFGLILACILSLFLSIIAPLKYAGQGPQVSFFADILKAWYLFLPFFLAATFSTLTPHTLKKVIKSWIIFSAIVSIVGLFQFYTGWPRPQGIPDLPGRYHATLFFGHHLSTASILIFPFWVMLSLAFSRSKSLQDLRVPRWLMISMSGITLATLFLTWSRTLWVALPIGLLVWLFRYLKKSQWIAALVAIGLLSLGAGTLPSVQNRLLSLRGTDTRFELWKANWDFFKERPLLGIGWRKPENLTGFYFKEKYPADSSARFVGHAHNNFLEMLGGTGLIGTLLWLIWSFSVFRLSWLSSRRKDFWGDLSWGIFCAWIVFHLNGLTQVNFWEGKVLHQMMWTTGILLAIPYISPQEELISTT